MTIDTVPICAVDSTQMSKSVPDRRLTRGAIKVKKLMASRKMGTSAFAKAAGVHRVTLHKVIAGERWQHVSVDFAISMREISGGKILLEDFSSVTAIKVDDVEDDDADRPTGTSD